MTRLWKRLPVAAWCVGVALLGAAGYGLARAFVSKENAAVEWALRLPKERERARLAGFVGTPRVAPATNPATDAGVDWVLLDARMRANAPDGKLPGSRILIRYANPRTRAKVKRAGVRAVWKRCNEFLPDAERAARKPRCFLPYRRAASDLDGLQAAVLLGYLHLVAATDERERATVALPHLRTALRIGWQLQAQASLSASVAGFNMERVALRLAREGLTTPDAAARAAWREAFAGYAKEFLHPAEPRPLAQFTGLLQSDHQLVAEILAKERAKKYDVKRNRLAESVPVLRLLNRLDFVLGRRVGCDSWEATSAWAMVGVATRLRGCDAAARSYTVWKRTQEWDDFAERVTRSDPEYLRPGGWADVPLRRVYRDSDRALTDAVYRFVCGKGESRPDDPFAAQPNTPVRLRNLPGGIRVWYSVGENGKDDGGDFRKDNVVRVLPVAKDKL